MFFLSKYHTYFHMHISFVKICWFEITNRQRSAFGVDARDEQNWKTFIALKSTAFFLYYDSRANKQRRYLRMIRLQLGRLNPLPAFDIGARSFLEGIGQSVGIFFTLPSEGAHRWFLSQEWVCIMMHARRDVTNWWHCWVFVPLL